MTKATPVGKMAKEEEANSMTAVAFLGVLTGEIDHALHIKRGRARMTLVVGFEVVEKKL